VGLPVLKALVHRHASSGAHVTLDEHDLVLVADRLGDLRLLRLAGATQCAGPARREDLERGVLELAGGLGGGGLGGGDGGGLGDAHVGMTLEKPVK
jgi:hypothetical protein